VIAPVVVAAPHPATIARSKKAARRLSNRAAGLRPNLLRRPCEIMFDIHLVDDWLPNRP
jgi:hypothetical protein